jgi:hypothetical protein
VGHLAFVMDELYGKWSNDGWKVKRSFVIEQNSGIGYRIRPGRVDGYTYFGSSRLMSL